MKTEIIDDKLSSYAGRLDLPQVDLMNFIVIKTKDFSESLQQVLNQDLQQRLVIHIFHSYFTPRKTEWYWFITFVDRDFPNVAITVDNKYDLLSFSCLARRSAWKTGKALVEKMFR